MILQRLKHETRTEHLRIETRLDLLDESVTLARYDALLQRFYGFYAPLEARLLSRPEWAQIGFDAAARAKVPLLQRDLERRGVSTQEIHDLARCHKLPDVRAFARSLGSLYVLEGATLGGQILARHFARVLELHAGNGAAFFASYGENIGPMWREFGALLCAQATSPPVETQMIEAARETFVRLEAWLCDDARVVR
jgi:heme oxygenase